MDGWMPDINTFWSDEKGSLYDAWILSWWGLNPKQLKLRQSFLWYISEVKRAVQREGRAGQGKEGSSL